MSLLSVVQQFCLRTGLPSPVAVMSSGDAQLLQIAALANEIVEDLCDRWTWQRLTKQAEFLTVNGELQGNILTLAPEGFLRISQETIFNRSLRLPIFGPLWAQDWQALKALPQTGPFNKYRIRDNLLLFMPPGTAGQTCAFEYATSWAIGDNSTIGSKSSFTLDTDIFILDERLLLAGLRWKWKEEKGLDYAEDFRRYETLANNAAGRDATKPRLNLAGGNQDYKPGIWVPSGNWNVSNP